MAVLIGIWHSIQDHWVLHWQLSGLSLLYEEGFDGFDNLVLGLYFVLALFASMLFAMVTPGTVTLATFLAGLRFAHRFIKVTVQDGYVAVYVKV